MRTRITGGKARILAHLTVLALVMALFSLATALPARAAGPANSTITGRVTDAHGLPMSALVVRLDNIEPEPGTYRSAGPNDDGDYTFTALPAGVYRLSFSPQEDYRYAGEWWDDAFNPGDSRTIVLDGENTAVADAVIGEWGVVRGTITGLAGRPLSSVSIQPYLVEASGEVAQPKLLSDSGSYRIRSLRPGTYRAVFRQSGYRSREITFTIGLDEAITRDIVLEPSAEGEFSSVTAEPMIIPPEGWGRATIRVRVTPRTYADALALDSSACGPDSYSWKAEVVLYHPRGGYDIGTTYTGSGSDPGTLPTELREYQLGYSRGALLGTYEVRVNVQSTVSYESCGTEGTRILEHTWSETLTTGMEFTGILDAPRPVIVGTPARGETLTAQVGTWSPEPSSQSLRWLRDGVAIPGATADDYTLTAADVDTRISVEARGTLDQYEDLTVESLPSDPVAGDPWTSAPVPTIVGLPATGQTLTAADGTWDAGATLSHQWLRDGVAIPHATAPNYRLVSADLDTRISVTVTGRKPGSARLAVTSAPTAVVVQGTINAPTPTIVGTLATGQQLTAVPGNWPEGTEFHYTWLADGRPIWLSNDPTYVVPFSESGRHISVQVMGTLDGCPQVFVTSAPTAKVMLASVPRVSGPLTVGSKVSAHRGTWTAKASLRYQWLRDGAVIKGATGKSYRLRTADAGRSLEFRVSASLSGYAPVTLSSAPTLRVVSAGKPRILGKAAVGSILTASPGRWTPGLVPTYQWLRNGREVPAANGSTYSPTGADRGARLSVRVTQSLPGWATVVRTTAKTARVVRRR